jgi:glutathione S-transferase
MVAASTAAPLLPTLQYFAFRGRAFASRVALFNSLGKDGWVDERVSLPRFKKVPKPERNPDRVNSEYVTNNLPQLILPCGTKITQSHAIARYAAKISPPALRLPEHFCPNLYPADPQKALIVDEAIAVIDQILLLTPKDADPETRAKNRHDYHTSGFLRVGMELLEGRIRQSSSSSGGSGPFLLGDELSLADLYVRAPLGDLFDLQQFEGVPDDFYDSFPRVQACAAAVPEHPLLQAYHKHYKN